jgi:hypothetical protein
VSETNDDHQAKNNNKQIEGNVESVIEEKLSRQLGLAPVKGELSIEINF